MIRDVTDLDVYNISLALLKDTYTFIRLLPKSEYDSVNQIRRAAKSISANIAEGLRKDLQKKSLKDF